MREGTQAGYFPFKWLMTTFALLSPPLSFCKDLPEPDSVEEEAGE
jgi:hypothetical protein